jgi:hypothetical protein
VFGDRDTVRIWTPSGDEHFDRDSAKDDRGYEAIADTTCSASTIRNRRDEWIKARLFAQPKQIALDAYDRIVDLLLNQIALDGCSTKAPDGVSTPARARSIAAHSA